MTFLCTEKVTISSRGPTNLSNFLFERQLQIRNMRHIFKMPFQSRSTTTRFVTLLILGIVASVMYLSLFSKESVENADESRSRSTVGEKTPGTSNMKKNGYNPNFQTRNNSDLLFRLSGIRKFMEPFVKEAIKAANELRNQNLKWVVPNETPVVVNGYEEGYFQKLTHPQIKTIIVNVKKEEIFKYLFNQVFDYTGSNCSQMESPLMHPLTKNSEFHYGAKCVPFNVSLSPVPFHDNAFRLGMPANYTVQQNGQVALTFLHVIRNAIATRDGDVHVANLKIVPQRCLQSLKPTKPRNVPKDSKEEVFTVSQFYGGAYYHDITENLSRLSPWLDFLKKNKHIQIHTASKSSFLQKIFNSLGLDPSRMITGTVRAKILYMPPASTCGRSIAFNGQLLSLQFRQAMQTPPQPRKSIVVIKRSAKRWFKNHDQICQMIRKVVQGTDIKVEIFSDKKLPTFEQTMAIFNRAFMVIGPHGAGQTNLFFSEEGTVNLEGQCVIHGTANLCYRNLMTVLGHRYYGLSPDRGCQDTKPEQLEEPVRRYIKDLYLNGSA